MIIDAHIHFTPPSMAEKLDEFSVVEPFWGMMLTSDPVNRSLQGWATPERMIDDMDKAGIDKVVLLGGYRQTVESCIETNNETLDIIRRWPDRVIGFAVVQPRPVEKALDEMKRCLDGGMLGLGELSPYGQGLDFDDPGFLKVIEACIDHDIPVNMHTNEEVGHFYLGKTITPMLNYYHLAYRYPELRLILAHWGGGLFLYELMPEVKRVLQNVWYDTAASPLLFPTNSIFKTALTCIDHRKLLFGSDYPLLVYPGKQTEPDFIPFLTEIDNLGLEKEVYADIMGNNTGRLLGIIEQDKVAEVKVHARKEKKVVTHIENTEGVDINGFMAVRAIANAWPETREVLEKYDIAWKDNPVPFWEPLAQAAAARGMGTADRERLVQELNEAISKKK